MVSDDWIGGWDSGTDAGGGSLPPSRVAALAVRCPACQKTDLRIRSSEPGSPVCWLECRCGEKWKEVSASITRAFIIR